MDTPEQDQPYIDELMAMPDRDEYTSTEHERAAAATFVSMMRRIAREEVASAFGMLTRRTEDIPFGRKTTLASSQGGDNFVTASDLAKMFGEGLRDFSSESAPGSASPGQHMAQTLGIEDEDTVEGDEGA